MESVHGPRDVLNAGTHGERMSQTMEGVGAVTELIVGELEDSAQTKVKL